MLTFAIMRICILGEGDAKYCPAATGRNHNRAGLQSIQAYKDRDRLSAALNDYS
jgi:hypothetical protein